MMSRYAPSRTRSGWPRTTLFGLFAIALATSACSGARSAENDDDEAEEEEQPTPVVVDSVRAGPISATISAASTIEAERQVTVHAESTGRIVQLGVEEGDKVSKGTLIARIKYDAQAAGLDRATTSLTKAQTDLETIEKLFAQKVASKQELDAARLTFEQASLDLRDRKRDVKNTLVAAPFDGTITERFVDAGGFVTNGAQLVTITDFSTLVARVYVPEKELDRIAEGQVAQIFGKAAKGRKGEGKISRIAPVVDPTTGTVKVTIALPESLVGGQTGFLPGMYAEVTLTTDQRERATLVPKEALVRSDEQAFVFVAEGDRVKRVKVELGLGDDKHAEVLSGVEVGQEVVVAGQAGLKDGALIRRVDPSGSPIEDSAGEGVGVAERVEPPPAEGA